MNHQVGHVHKTPVQILTNVVREKSLQQIIQLVPVKLVREYLVGELVVKFLSPSCPQLIHDPSTSRFPGTHEPLNIGRVQHDAKVLRSAQPLRSVVYEHHTVGRGQQTTFREHYGVADEVIPRTEEGRYLRGWRVWWDRGN
uniref:(northern house mosquito) hypothetical protein n=1 Tax=Culex pipiens TaxID=7175 RepID=A0A8D8FB83_CULPI